MRYPHYNHISNRIVTHVMSILLCFLPTLAFGVWLYMSAVLLTFACARFFINHLTGSDSI